MQARLRLAHLAASRPAKHCTKHDDGDDDDDEHVLGYGMWSEQGYIKVPNVIFSRGQSHPTGCDRVPKPDSSRHDPC
jgi:hypothetical protein